MTIRQAKTKDLDRIYQITLEAFRPYCAVQAIKERYGIGSGVELKARSVRSFCERNLDRVLVAEEEGMVVGYYSSCPHEEYGMEQLAANAVDPAFQGRGIGTQMARKVVHELIETRSQEILFVATLVHDKPARRVYEKIGFTEVYRQISFSNWKHLLDPQPLEAQAGGDSTAPAGANGSSTEWCIRAAGPADKDRLFEIALHDPAVRFSPERLMAARFGTLAGKTWQQRRTEQVQNQLESDRVFVAENGGSIGGYASLSWSAESEFGRVTYPSVDPESGDAGLHDRLLAHLLHQAREVASLRIVDIGVCAEDADAVTRCQGAGFEEFNCGIGFAMRRDEAVFS